MAVELILTERQSQLTEERARNYDRLRERLGAIGGEPVEAVHYEELEPARLAGASAIVLSGATAPYDTHAPGALLLLGDRVVAARRPVLGICAGMQLQALFAGGRIGPGSPEHGFGPIEVADRSDLLRGLPEEVVVWQEHTEEIAAVPDGFRVLASSERCAVQAIADPARRWWGTQFHPEEFTDEHPAGERVLRNFFTLARG